MSEVLYHPEVYIPESFVMPTGRVALKWSNHAKRAAQEDRYGNVPLFETISLRRFYLVELGMQDNKVSKIVVRGEFDAVRDVVFVLVPEPKHYFVKTVWFNLRTDQHKTLDRKRYAVA